MWSEDKYLSLAPRHRLRPMNIIYDEHAELSFPGIYLSKPRKFKMDRVTPFMMATGEIRRRDRQRGEPPEHVLYMALKMRLRIAKGINNVRFKNTADIAKLTRQEVQDQFLERCAERTFAFMDSIPKSASYWNGKNDVYAMIRQFGKPTFLTLSISQYKNSYVLRILYKLKHGKEYEEGGDPATGLSSHERTTLVSEDPVTCCVSFNRLVDALMYILCHKKHSAFGEQ